MAIVGDKKMVLSDLVPSIHSSSSSVIPPPRRHTRVQSWRRSRGYLLNDGRAVTWELGATVWEVGRHLSSLLPSGCMLTPTCYCLGMPGKIPTGDFLTPGPRDLTLRPRAHSDSDDIVESILALMQENPTVSSSRRHGGFLACCILAAL
jgi:hypothetical protein